MKRQLIGLVSVLQPPVEPTTHSRHNIKSHIQTLVGVS